MQNLIFSLNATLPVFLVMVVGYALGQLGFLPPAFCKASDRLTFKVTLPLMLFLDMGSVDILHDFRPRFVLFCFAACKDEQAPAETKNTKAQENTAGGVAFYVTVGQTRIELGADAAPVISALGEPQSRQEIGDCAGLGAQG